MRMGADYDTVTELVVEVVPPHGVVVPEDAADRASVRQGGRMVAGEELCDWIKSIPGWYPSNHDDDDADDEHETTLRETSSKALVRDGVWTSEPLSSKYKNRVDDVVKRDGREGWTVVNVSRFTWNRRRD